MQDLTNARYLSLATWRRDGREVRTPLWFVTLDGEHYCYTSARTGKVKRIRRSARAGIAPCDIRGRLTGSGREASARLVDDAATCTAVYCALRAKYGWSMRLLDVIARLTGRETQRVVIGLREE